MNIFLIIRGIYRNVTRYRAVIDKGILERLGGMIHTSNTSYVKSRGIIAGYFGFFRKTRVMDVMHSFNYSGINKEKIKAYDLRIQTTEQTKEIFLQGKRMEAIGEWITFEGKEFEPDDSLDEIMFDKVGLNKYYVLGVITIFGKKERMLHLYLYSWNWRKLIYSSKI